MSDDTQTTLLYSIGDHEKVVPKSEPQTTWGFVGCRNCAKTAKVRITTREVEPGPYEVNLSVNKQLLDVTGLRCPCDCTGDGAGEYFEHSMRVLRSQIDGKWYQFCAFFGENDEGKWCRFDYPGPSDDHCSIPVLSIRYAPPDPPPTKGDVRSWVEVAST